MKPPTPDKIFPGYHQVRRFHSTCSSKGMTVDANVHYGHAQMIRMPEGPADGFNLRPFVCFLRGQIPLEMLEPKYLVRRTRKESEEFETPIWHPQILISMISRFLDVSLSPKTNYFFFFETPGYFTKCKTIPGLF